jgi:hypothetical protein
MAMDAFQVGATPADRGGGEGVDTARAPQIAQVVHLFSRGVEAAQPTDGVAQAQPKASADGYGSSARVKGLLNYRDAGGMVAEVDGVSYPVKHGLLGRSDDPNRINDLDGGFDLGQLAAGDALAATLPASARVVVVDLRSSAERLKDKDSLFSQLVLSGRVRVMHRPVEEGDRKFGSDRNKTWWGIKNGVMYFNLAVMNDDHIGSALWTATNPSSLPDIIHCASGKDRTGIVSAFRLGLLGISSAQITDDYTATQQNNAALLEKHAIDCESQATALEAQGKFGEAKLARDDAAFRRSPEALAQTAATPEQFQIFENLLRDALVVPDSASVLDVAGRAALRRHYETYWMAGSKHIKFTSEQLDALTNRHVERFRTRALVGYVLPPRDVREIRPTRP